MSAIQITTENNTLSVRFQPCTREPLSWKEELYAAARDVASRATKPLWLCASGGTDSEVMLHAFFDQGINFSVLTLEHTGSTNEHDIRRARAWCRKYAVHQKIVPLDISVFFEKEIPAYIADGYASYQLLRYIQLKLMETAEELGGFAVIAAGRQHYRVAAGTDNPVPNDVFLEFTSGHAVPLEWCKRHAASHEPYFMYRTPELCLSYPRIPLIRFALDNPDMLKQPLSAITFKRLVMLHNWPALRARTRFHGFEKIIPQTIAVKRLIREKTGDNLSNVRLSVPEFMAQLTANHS